MESLLVLKSLTSACCKKNGAYLTSEKSSHFYGIDHLKWKRALFLNYSHYCILVLEMAKWSVVLPTLHNGKSLVRSRQVFLLFFISLSLLGPFSPFLKLIF